MSRSKLKKFSVLFIAAALFSTLGSADEVPPLPAEILQNQDLVLKKFSKYQLSQHFFEDLGQEEAQAILSDTQQEQNHYLFRTTQNPTAPGFTFVISYQYYDNSTQKFEIQHDEFIFGHKKFYRIKKINGKTEFIPVEVSKAPIDPLYHIQLVHRLTQQITPNMVNLAQYRFNELKARYGFFSNYNVDEAARKLSNYPIGTYLIRASSNLKDSDCGFTLSYKADRTNVRHVRIIQENNQLSYDSLDSDGLKTRSQVRSLEDILERLNLVHNFLDLRFLKSVKKENGFYKNLDSLKATDLLEGHPPGTYLLRPSSTQEANVITLSHVELIKNRKVQVTHRRLRFKNGKIYSDQGKFSWSSFDQIKEKFNLGIPFQCNKH